jgi:hypothetical protein
MLTDNNLEGRVRPKREVIQAAVIPEGRGGDAAEKGTA